jgi:hypothetical protein
MYCNKCHFVKEKWELAKGSKNPMATNNSRPTKLPPFLSIIQESAYHTSKGDIDFHNLVDKLMNHSFQRSIAVMESPLTTVINLSLECSTLIKQYTDKPHSRSKIFDYKGHELKGEWNKVREVLEELIECNKLLGKKIKHAGNIIYDLHIFTLGPWSELTAETVTSTDDQNSIEMVEFCKGVIGHAYTPFTTKAEYAKCKSKPYFATIYGTMLHIISEFGPKQELFKKLGKALLDHDPEKGVDMSLFGVASMDIPEGFIKMGKTTGFF